MGLAERRAVKEFQDTKFPALQKQITEAAGFDVELEVKWDQLAKDEYAHLYGEAFEKVYFKPLVDALKSISQDEMGRDALKASVRKILLCNSSGSYGSDTITFDGGVLRVDHDPVTNLDDWQERRDAVVKLLESKL